MTSIGALLVIRVKENKSQKSASSKNAGGASVYDTATWRLDAI